MIVKSTLVRASTHAQKHSSLVFARNLPTTRRNWFCGVRIGANCRSTIGILLLSYAVLAGVVAARSNFHQPTTTLSSSTSSPRSDEETQGRHTHSGSLLLSSPLFALASQETPAPRRQKLTLERGRKVARHRRVAKLVARIHPCTHPGTEHASSSSLICPC